MYRKQVLLVSAQVWQEVASGWQEVGFSSYQCQVREQESSYLGLNRVTKKRGPQLPIPDSVEGQPTPPGHLRWGWWRAGKKNCLSHVSAGSQGRQPITYLSKVTR